MLTTTGNAEIREFPKALISGGDEVYGTVLCGLSNCLNLQSLIWTRDGSLNSAVLQVLLGLKGLKELQINGNSQGYYNPMELEKFDRLESITVIMPSAIVVESLPRWVEKVGGGLKSLTIICKVRDLH